MDNEIYPDLYSWFEKSGVISNVRTHLRQNLINVLKNRDLDLKKDSAPKSAKQYVYDLLIAEYLFNHNYAYTLSVFASEAPMLVNFHAMTPSAPASNNKGTVDKLQSDYALHTLETLGIDPCGPKGRYIISQYVESDLPLLLCVLKSTPMSSFNTQNDKEEEKGFCNKYSQTEDPWDSYSMDASKLMAMKRRMLQQKKVFDSKLKEREMMLKEQAIVMEEQLVCLNEKLQEVQGIMHSITLKEKELNERRQNNEQHTLQKQIELTCKEKLLLQEANRKFEDDLRKLQEELAKVQRELPPKNERSIAGTRNTEVQTDPAIDVAKENEVRALIRENKNLNSLVREQQLRIEQITQRALQLSRQVEDIHLLRPTATDTPMKTINTVISESSSTEDILQDAKLRLKRLEEESLKADQHYYNFIDALT